jgi:hypothetical protein
MPRFLIQQRSLTLRVAAVLAIALSGTGCTSQLADLAEPADTPARPAVAPAYPAVHDMPSPRDTNPMTAAERQRIMDELSAIRDRQEAETADPPPGKKTSGTTGR